MKVKFKVWVGVVFGMGFVLCMGLWVRLSILF